MVSVWGEKKMQIPIYYAKRVDQWKNLAFMNLFFLEKIEIKKKKKKSNHAEFSISQAEIRNNEFK